MSISRPKPPMPSDPGPCSASRLRGMWPLSSPPAFRGLSPSPNPAVRHHLAPLSSPRLASPSSDDIQSIGIVRRDNQKTGQPVIAGDADKNDVASTLSPAVAGQWIGIQP